MSPPIDEFLRSINLRFDLEHPQRFAHFRPTGKSSQVIDLIARGSPHRASLVVAAYGSGKSIAAGSAALLVDNASRSRTVLERLSNRVEPVDGSLARFARERLDSPARGLALVLEGDEENVGAALRRAAARRLGSVTVPNDATDNDPVAVLEAVKRRAAKDGIDRIAVIWDEFGRYLEWLATSGHPEALGVVQRIAEWVSRQERPSATFNLLLHQGFSQYAGSLSQSARNAWRKIEGRFASVQFVDDSEQMYRLIADVVAECRPETTTPPSETVLFQAAAEARSHGFFADFPDDGSLAEVLRDAYPLEPATLYMLPRLAARVAQNERTVFDFVNDADLSRPVTLKDLYEVFSPALEADTGLGGVHRRWLETESALTKVDDAEEAAAITAAALLGLGHAGQRARVGRDALLCAVRGYDDCEENSLLAAIERLIERNLLLYRERTEDVTVWHGTDLDLRRRLEEEKIRLEPEFDALEFISRTHPPPSWRPVTHNVRHGLRRYYGGRYVRATELIEQGEDHPVWTLKPGDDGRVVYALPVTDTEASTLFEAPWIHAPADPGIVLAVPQESVPYHDVALEVAALERLVEDSDLMGSDPFAPQEVQYMLDAAQLTLGRVMQRAVAPTGNTGPYWFSDREPRMKLRDEGELTALLSNLAEERFHETPVINNELIVRRKLSRPMVNARKKVLLGVFERTGEPKLGFGDEMTSPDASAYRTVFERTGLYTERGGGEAWRWSTPDELAVEAPRSHAGGLKTVWARLRDYFTEAGVKYPSEILNELRDAPHGLRDGVLPLLFGAALRAFGECVAIRRDGHYLTDVLASEIEQLCSEPNRFTVEIIPLEKASRAYLEGVVECFGQRSPASGDLLRDAYDALLAWRKQLPPTALRTKRVSDRARRFQRAVRGEFDPVDLLFSTLPGLIGAKSPGDGALDMIDDMRREIEQIVEGFTAAALEAIRATLTLDPQREGKTLARAHEWALCFPNFLLTSDLVSGDAKALLRAARDAESGRYTEASFARALSAILVGKGFDRWDDQTPREFASKLREVAQQLESVAVESETPAPSLQPLLERRLKFIYDQLRKAGGADAAADALRHIRPEGEESEDGEYHRRAQ